MKGLAALPLASVLAYPELARAAGHYATKPVSVKTPGAATAMGVVAMPANHAFANPTGSRYDEQDAALAWERTLAFFAKHLS